MAKVQKNNLRQAEDGNTNCMFMSGFKSSNQTMFHIFDKIE
jgi:hypothetical protein